MIKVNLEHAYLDELSKYVDQNRLNEVSEMIYNKTGLGSDFLGWVNWPTDFDKDEYSRMKQTAKKIQSKVDVCLVIGIGGSYLGARAADNMINGLYNANKKVEMIYVGNTMSGTYLAQVKEYLKDKNFAIINVSKSGTTTEPSISFRIFEEQLVSKVGEATAKDLIIAVTDKARGALFTLASNKGYERFVIPDDIGGRFSVLTPVGILPLLISGADVDAIFEGAKKAQASLNKVSFDNPAIQYAIARYALHTKKNYKAEALVSYEMQLQMFTEWWKQLFGESEGKDDKGLLPLSMIFSTDLHSLGQFVQDGTKGILFETIIDVKNPTLDINVPKTADDLDKMNYLTNRTVNEINAVALQGVIDAHANAGKIPNIILEFDKMDATQFGYAVYFFELAVAYSGYLLGINPFNQPGVEIYKKNMFKLLGKPE